MKIIKQPTLYKCNICGRISENRNEIQKCEARGKSEVLLKVGDEIYFIDNEVTPVVHGKLQDIIFIDQDRINMFNKCYVTGSIKNKYQIVEIIDKGHDYSYVLGKNGYPVYTFRFTSGSEYVYPIVNGNKLMQKILKEYN